MHKKILIFLFFFFFSNFLFSQEIDEELKNLQWNRYVNDNIVVLSIDDKQGRWLSNNVPKIISSCAKQWKIDENLLGFSREFRIFCVPNKNLLEKLFGIDSSKVEVRRDANDAIEISVMWIILEELKSNDIAPFVLRPAFFEFGENNFALPWWFVRSAEILSGSNDFKSNVLSCLFEEVVLLESNKILETSYNEYSDMNLDDKNKFDLQALILTLMLRKELGIIKFKEFIKYKSPYEDVEDRLKNIYGYKDIEEFQGKYLNFYRDFLDDFNSNKVPISYLNP